MIGLHCPPFPIYDAVHTVTCSHASCVDFSADLQRRLFEALTRGEPSLQESHWLQWLEAEPQERRHFRELGAKDGHLSYEAWCDCVSTDEKVHRLNTLRERVTLSGVAPFHRHRSCLGVLPKPKCKPQLVS